MSFHAPKHDAPKPLGVNHRAGSTNFRADRAAQGLSRFGRSSGGAVALEAAQVFGDSKPASGLEFGLDAWLMAVSMRE